MRLLVSIVACAPSEADIAVYLCNYIARRIDEPLAAWDAPARDVDLDNDAFEQRGTRVARVPEAARCRNRERTRKDGAADAPLRPRLAACN